jgi:hypothetical protein
MRFRSTVAVVLAGSLIASAVACEIRVRDSAFRTIRDVHRLCIIGDSTDPSLAEIEQRLQTWLESLDGDVNVKIQRVHADDAHTNWESLGIPSAPPSLPVTVLVGRDNRTGKNFVIDHWEPEPDEESLTAIVRSPTRKRLANLLAKHLAVLVYSPQHFGTDSARTEQLRSLSEKGIADERIGLAMLSFDRIDPAERVLARFIGLRPDSPDTLCVAFGRGKLMSPPLQGDAITEESINQLVYQLRQACSCSKPLATMGVDLPLAWPDKVDATVVLMDEELELSELAAKVQKMFDAKTESHSASLELVVIPPGDDLRDEGSDDIEPAGEDDDHSATLSLPGAWLVGIVLVAALSITGTILWIRGY